MNHSPKETDLKSRISQVLGRDPDLRTVEVRIKEGQVILEGVVGSASKRLRAEQVARDLAPGFRLASHLALAAEASDEEWQRQALKLIDGHGELADQQMAVIVENGTARMVGQVARPDLRLEAIRLIESRLPALTVDASELRVASGAPDGGTLTAQIESSLTVEFPKLAVSQRSGGVVLLTGEVAHPSQRLKAVEMVQRFGGVKAIIAQIIVSGSGFEEDAALQATLAPLLPPGLRAHVHGGITYLTGHLADERARQQVEDKLLTLVPLIMSDVTLESD